MYVGDAFSAACVVAVCTALVHGRRVLDHGDGSTPGGPYTVPGERETDEFTTPADQRQQSLSSESTVNDRQETGIYADVARA